MRGIGVNWGSAPDVAAPMSSLGRALGSAMSGGGGNTLAAQSRAARDAAYIESLNQRNQYVQAQERALQEKTALDAAEAQQKFDLANQQSQRAQTAAEAEFNAQHDRIKPAGVGVLATNDPAIVQYREDWKRVAPMKERFSYIYGNGDGNPEQRAGAANQSVGGAMAEVGSQNDFIRGNSLMGRNLTEKNLLPSANGPVPINPDGTAAKAGSPKLTMNKDKTAYIKNGPNGPEWVPIKGASPTGGVGTDTEALDSVNRALKSYSELALADAIGPIVGSEKGMAISHYLSRPSAKLREEYEAARNKLVFIERKRLMKGQGNVTEDEGKKIERMFPTFDAVDPEVGVRTLLEMKKRLEGGAPGLYDPVAGGFSGVGEHAAPAPEGGATGDVTVNEGGFPEGTIAENPETGETKILRNGQWVDQ